MDEDRGNWHAGNDLDDGMNREYMIYDRRDHENDRIMTMTEYRRYARRDEDKKREKTKTRGRTKKGPRVGTWGRA